jgi:hypothetical protein
VAALSPTQENGCQGNTSRLKSAKKETEKKDVRFEAFISNERTKIFSGDLLPQRSYRQCFGGLPHVHKLLIYLPFVVILHFDFYDGDRSPKHWLLIQLCRG